MHLPWYLFILRYGCGHAAALSGQLQHAAAVEYITLVDFWCLPSNGS